jgi:hypothetical protein
VELGEVHVAGHDRSGRQAHPEKARICLVRQRSDEHSPESEYTSLPERFYNVADECKWSRKAEIPKARDEGAPFLEAGFYAAEGFDPFGDLGIVLRTDVFRIFARRRAPGRRLVALVVPVLALLLCLDVDALSPGR